MAGRDATLRPPPPDGITAAARQRSRRTARLAPAQLPQGTQRRGPSTRRGARRPKGPDPPKGRQTMFTYPYLPVIWKTWSVPRFPVPRFPGACDSPRQPVGQAQRRPEHQRAHQAAPRIEMRRFGSFVVSLASQHRPPAATQRPCLLLAFRKRFWLGPDLSCARTRVLRARGQLVARATRPPRAPTQRPVAHPTAGLLAVVAQKQYLKSKKIAQPISGSPF